MSEPEQPVANVVEGQGYVSGVSLPGFYEIVEHLPISPNGWQACFEWEGKGVPPTADLICWVLARSNYGPRTLHVCGISTYRGPAEICENDNAFLGYSKVEAMQRTLPKEVHAAWFPEKYPDDQS